MKTVDVWVLSLWKTSFQPLFAQIGTDPLLVVISSPFVDIVEKVDRIQKELGYKVVWMSKKLVGLARNPEKTRTIADFATITRAVRLRPHRNKVIFLMIESVCSFSSIERIRQACPGAKLVSYAYDWQHLFCPLDKIDLWEQYVEGGRDFAEREYAAIDNVIRGRNVDAVVHKDYGNNWPMLGDCKAQAGSLWMPPVLPERIYQKPPSTDVEDKFCYIGTIVPKRTHGRDAALFQDIMMEEIFKQVANQGFHIDAFVLSPDKEVIETYKELFPKGNVKVHQGRLLGQLLPLLQGRYKFGWMLYHWPNKLIMKHIAVTIPIKFFSYLALGVPILIAEEMKACVRLVEKYGCGIVFSQKDLDNVREKIADYDYEKLIEGVKKAREEMEVSKYQPKMVKIIKKVMELPYEKTTFGREKKKDEVRCN